MHTLKTKGLLFLGASLIIFGGCTNNPQLEDDGTSFSTIPKEKVYIDTSSGNKIIEKHYIYTPDVDLKSAVAILIKKVERLESKKPFTYPAAKVSYKGCGPAVPTLKKAKKKIKHKDGLYQSYSKVPVWSCATKRGSRLSWVYKQKKVRLIDCGIYGWCKIKGQKGYVQAWRLKRIGN
jgi:hypothetical protein